MNDLTDLITGAIGRHRAGDLAEARKRYTSILTRDPRNLAMLHLLATLEAQEGILNPAPRIRRSALPLTFKMVRRSGDVKNWRVHLYLIAVSWVPLGKSNLCGKWGRPRHLAGTDGNPRRTASAALIA